MREVNKNIREASRFLRRETKNGKARRNGVGKKAGKGWTIFHGENVSGILYNSKRCGGNNFPGRITSGFEFSVNKKSATQIDVPSEFRNSRGKLHFEIFRWCIKQE